MEYSQAIERLHDAFDQYHCSVWWWRKDKGIEVRFGHQCGDGCCSWSEDRWIDHDSNLGRELATFFTDHPHGDEPYIEEE